MEPVTHIYSKGMATPQEPAVSKVSVLLFPLVSSPCWLFGFMHGYDICQSKARIQLHTPVAYRQCATYGLLVTGYMYIVLL